MGRKPISPKTRSIPVSFSVKPHLADKIENLAYDQRFTRSKFLQEAVLRYINFIEMKDSPMLHDMTCEQRVAIGANALQEAARDGDEISPRIIAHLKTQLVLFEMRNQIDEIDANIAETEQALAESQEPKITFENYGASRHFIRNNGSVIGKIIKQNRKWIILDNEMSGGETYRTLRSAKEDVVSYYEGE